MMYKVWQHCKVPVVSTVNVSIGLEWLKHDTLTSVSVSWVKVDSSRIKLEDEASNNL